MEIKVTVSIGELIDKISILEIKKNKIKDKSKLTEVSKELSYLKNICETKLKNYDYYVKQLKRVNRKLWDIENLIRKKEDKKEFDKEFIELARKVYKTNDIRFILKSKINSKFNSELKEQKSYS